MGRQERLARLKLGRAVESKEQKLALGAVALVGLSVSFMWMVVSDASRGTEEIRIPAFFESLQRGRNLTG